MNTASKLHVAAPSPSLLRFLRSQINDTCFFSPNDRLERHYSPAKARRLVHRNRSNGLPPWTRGFGTSPSHQATVESSSLNLDFLKHPSRQHNPTARPLPTPSTYGLGRDWVQQPVRHASTDDQSFLRRLWQRRRIAPPALKEGDLPPRPSFLDEGNGTSLGRSKAGKAANELRLRCTEINENGDVTLVNGEFKKSELIAKVRIN